MRSTDYNTPPKLIIMALIIVIGLHVLTVVALMQVKTSIPTVEPIQTSSPIEIQLLTLPPAQKADSEPESPNSAATIKESIQPQSETKPVETATESDESEPVEAPNKEDFEPVEAAKNVESSEPIADFEPIVVPNDVEDSEQIKVSKEVQDSEQEEDLASAANTEKRAATTVTTVTTVITKSDSEAGSSGAKVTESAPVYDNTYTSHSTNPSTPNTMATGFLGKNSEGGNRRVGAKPSTTETTGQASIDTKAVQQAAELAAQQNPNQQEQIVATFDTSDAKWVSTPKFNFSDKAKFGLQSEQTRTVLLSLMVKRDGSIESVNREQSSGNTVFDREAMQQIKKYQLQPFTTNDVAVRGKVIIPVEYEAP